MIFGKLGGGKFITCQTEQETVCTLFAGSSPSTLLSSLDSRQRGRGWFVVFALGVISKR